MKISVKKTAKVAGAVCAATGIVALSALVASGAAVGAVVEGFKSAKDTMKKMLADEKGKEILDEQQQSEESSVEDITEENESASEEIVTD